MYLRSKFYLITICFLLIHSLKAFGVNESEYKFKMSCEYWVHKYYGDHESLYREKIKNISIPNIPEVGCFDDLWRLAYQRKESKEYLQDSHQLGVSICINTIETGDADEIYISYVSRDKQLTFCCRKSVTKWESNNSKKVDVVKFDSYDQINQKNYKIYVVYNTGDSCVGCSDDTTNSAELGQAQKQEIKHVFPLTRLGMHGVIVLSLMNGFLAVECSDNSLKVLDLRLSGHEQCLASLKGHNQAVSKLIELTNGCLVLCSNDKSIKVWCWKKPIKEQYITTLNGHCDLSKPENETCIATLKEHKKSVNFIVQFDNGLLLSSSSDGIYKVWDMNNPKTDYFAQIPAEIIDIIASKLPVEDCLSLTTVNKRFYKNISDFLLVMKKKEFFSNNEQAYKTSIEFAEIPHLPSGMFSDKYNNNKLMRLVYWRCKETSQITIDSDNSHVVKNLKGHSGKITFFYKVGHNVIVSCSDDCSLKVWDISKSDGEECVLTLSSPEEAGHTATVYWVAQLNNGCLVSASEDNTLKLWDLKKQKGERCVNTLSMHQENVVGMVEIANEKLVTTDCHGTVRLCNFTEGNGECITMLKGEMNHNETEPVLIDHRYLATIAYDKDIKIWCLNDLEKIRCFTIQTGHSKNIVVLFKLRNNHLISVSNDFTIREWSMSNEKHIECVNIIKGYNYYIVSMKELKNGLLVSCCDEGQILILDLKKKKKEECITKLIDLHDADFKYMELMDGRLFVYCFMLGAKIFDLTRERQHKKLPTLLSEFRESNLILEINYNQFVFCDSLKYPDVLRIRRMNRPSE